MRKFTFLFLFLALSSFVFSQTMVINNFEELQDTNYWQYELSTNADSSLGFVNDTYSSSNSVSGNAMVIDYSAHNIEGWGGYSKIYHMAPDSQVYDWSAYDSVSFSFFTQTPQSLYERVHLRFQLYDVSDVDDTNSNANNMEFYYSFEYNVCDDSTSQWHKITLPLLADGNFWDGEGFNQTMWAGKAGNNHLDADKIKGYAFEFSISGAGEGDYSAGQVIFDELHLTGLAEDPWIIFNGKTLDPALAQFTWGQSNLEIVDGAGIDPKTNALLWTQGDEWANGWSGAGWNVSPAHDLGLRWGLDSVKFALKAEAGTNSPIRLQLESANGINGMAFEIVADDQWHDYSLSLADFYVIDGKADFDSSNITVVQMMGEGNASAGKKLWFDFIWTGNPPIDIVAPEAPTGVTPVISTYQNLVTWLDVPNESNSTYTVLYSMNPITSLEDAGIEAVASKIAVGTQIATHTIIAPVTDTELTYYYAVYATDAAGNVGALTVTDAVVNTAKGVTAIHPTAPVNFAADGDLSEWSTVAPFRMFPSDGSGTIVNNTVIDGDADLSVNAYVAFDENYLYFAFDAEDDVIAIDTTKSSYLIDSPDLYIGLYDWHGPSHTSYKTGDEPDYHFRFNSNQVILDNWGAQVLLRPTSSDYFWEEKFPSGYVAEGRISLDDLTARGDARFNPVVGMRIPIDFSINDADATGEREGILTYSINNQDKGWSDVSLWTYTWIGDKMTDVEENNLTVNAYGLSQNYPNPFNPSTVINYSIAKAGMVSLKIYNILGQEVMSLVNTNQNVGQYQVKFDASTLSTGLYIYRIQSGNFVDSKKMMLLK